MARGLERELGLEAAPVQEPERARVSARVLGSAPALALAWERALALALASEKEEARVQARSTA